jgi:hypothetical protein
MGKLLLALCKLQELVIERQEFYRIWHHSKAGMSGYNPGRGIGVYVQILCRVAGCIQWPYD